MPRRLIPDGFRNFEIVKPGQRAARSSDGIKVEPGKPVDFRDIVLQLPKLKVGLNR